MAATKNIELIGEPQMGWEDAAQRAVADAAKTVENITGVEVCNITAHIDKGRISEYKVNVKVDFGVLDC